MITHMGISFNRNALEFSKSVPTKVFVYKSICRMCIQGIVLKNDVSFLINEI